MSDSWLFPAVAFGAIVGLPALVIAWALALSYYERAKVLRVRDSMGPDTWGSQDIDPSYRGNQ
jgi:hypothetical protein